MKSLIAPKTAEFQSFLDAKTQIGPDYIIYYSYVDSQNGFGALIRTNYICSIKFNGIERNNINNWRVDKLIIQ